MDSGGILEVGEFLEDVGGLDLNITREIMLRQSDCHDLRLGPDRPLQMPSISHTEKHQASGFTLCSP